MSSPCIDFTSRATTKSETTDKVELSGRVDLRWLLASSLNSVLVFHHYGASLSREVGASSPLDPTKAGAKAKNAANVLETERHREALLQQIYWRAGCPRRNR